MTLDSNDSWPVYTTWGSKEIIELMRLLVSAIWEEISLKNNYNIIMMIIINL
jgi:hypothetical protein